DLRRAAGQRHGDRLTLGRQVRRDLEVLDPHPIGYPYPLPRPHLRQGRPSACHGRCGGRLVTTPLPEPVPDTTTPELDALETETRALIDRHLEGARDVAATTGASPVEATRRNSRQRDRPKSERRRLEVGLPAAARGVAAPPGASPGEAPRGNSRPMDRLRQARAAIIDTAMGAVRRAVPLGARDAAREAPPPAGTEV